MKTAAPLYGREQRKFHASWGMLGLTFVVLQVFGIAKHQLAFMALNGTVDLGASAGAFRWD